MKARIKKLLLRNRRPLIIALHMLLCSLAYFISFFLRFDLRFPQEYQNIFFKTLPLLLTVKFIVLYYFHIYAGLWSYVSVQDLWQIIKANAVATVAFIIAEVFVLGVQGFPRSVFIIDFIVCAGLIGGIRFFTRFLKERSKIDLTDTQKRVLIIGAGEAGVLTLKEYRRNPHLGEVEGFIDDDPVKLHETINGVKILGKREDICEIVQRLSITEIIIAMPSAKGEAIREILTYCHIPDVKVKIVPYFDKFLSGDMVLKPREIRPSDLLSRKNVKIDEDEIFRYLRDKRVLVTGAGVSICQELCRQIAHFDPKEIIFFDHNENDVYFLVLEFKTKYPKVDIKTVIGDIRDIGLLKQVFSHHKPQVVFHAAAHKHVPLMEENPVAAVKNNIVASRNLIYAAKHYGAERFVLVSTDKAVNPVNIMGMSKRITEMILQSKAKNSRTKFMAVRFGNVLGSAGSIVPLFKRQIEMGGPITITHPEVKRYFMSIPEAVCLILQAGALGKGGEIFILDMGEQIKILDLAKNLVSLSGLTLDKDIVVKFIGLRPGEKLAEELLLDREKDKMTKHELIYVSSIEGM
ncbi:MAG: nucleoside-diphosphate sugar epimerase/dehydratase, partial [Candidatus Omnitrophica bacterium]|nr:nucleoside-diphosphate sugar epimerase/dehydratase [Candidatus Omnitrophota bacterium]